MTTRGRTLAALAASMLIFGRVGGMRELIMAGACFAVVLAIGFVLVWLRGGRVSVRRSIHPARTIVGHPVRVELVVEATGGLGVGPVLLSDRIPPTVGPTPRLALPGGTRRRKTGVSYPLAPKMRGRYTIGPLEISHTDPFGAIRRRRGVAGTSQLVVFPSFDEISVLPSSIQRLGVVRHSPLVGQGDEFYALRQYEEGDDLRKIHWASSLRTGNLVIRQEELLAEPRALIVLDTCASKHRGTGATASLEAAVSACASVGVLALRRRMRLDVVTPDGPLLHQRSPTEYQFLEALADVQPSARKTMAQALERSDRPRGGRPALVVVISPELRRDEMRTVALKLRGSVGGALVLIDAATYDRSAGRTRRRVGLPDVGVLTLPVVKIAAGDSFRHAWHMVIKDVALAR